MPRQLQMPTSVPPMTGPTAGASPDTAAHTLMALLRARYAWAATVTLSAGSEALLPRVTDNGRGLGEA